MALTPLYDSDVTDDDLKLVVEQGSSIPALYARIMLAARQKRGVRLTYEEAELMTGHDHAVGMAVFAELCHLKGLEVW